jgi:hypothetical protein
MYSVGRRVVAGGVVLAAVAGGALISRADGAQTRISAADGGLQLKLNGKSDIIERPAGAGPLGYTITVANNSAKALDVTVAARPWTQSATGATSANRRKSLAGVTLSPTSFSLAPGASRVIAGTVTTGASEFGALEVVGIPSGAATQKGVVVGYRLLKSIRLDPAAPVYKLQAHAPKTTGSASRQQLVLPVENAGNTIAPVTGDVSLKGALGTRQRDLESVRILPGKTVNLLLTSTKSVKAGSYTATVTLKQGTTTTTVTKKKLRIKH